MMVGVVVVGLRLVLMKLPAGWVDQGILLYRGRNGLSGQLKKGKIVMI